MKKLILACCAALAIAACSPTTTSGPGPIGGAPVISTQGTVMDEKALIAAELAYNTAGESYLVARERGLLPAATLAQARTVLGRAYSALLLARRAYAIGDANTFAAQAALVFSAAAEAKRLLPQ